MPTKSDVTITPPTRANCFLRAVAHSETDFALYLYWGIPDIVEQLVTWHLPSVKKRGECYYLHGSETAYETLEQAGMAAFEHWQGKAGKR